jgi:opacity protein-like surface antigen
MMPTLLPLESAMRMLAIAVAVFILSVSSLYAQTDRLYIAGSGGPAAGPDGTSSDTFGEVGVRIAPRLFVFGDVGQIHNLQPSAFQPVVDSTTALLTGTGLDVNGTAREPAWYTLGGLRYETPAFKRVSPYVFGGVGFARVVPAGQFTFTSGTLPGATPAPGDDVTQQLTALGDFTQPAAMTAPMFSLGGGVEVPVMSHLSLDAGYRYDRIATDTPLNTHGATFGFGYRF